MKKLFQWSSSSSSFQPQNASVDDLPTASEKSATYEDLDNREVFHNKFGDRSGDEDGSQISLEYESAKIFDSMRESNEIRSLSENDSDEIIFSSRKKTFVNPDLIGINGGRKFPGRHRRFIKEETPTLEELRMMNLSEGLVISLSCSFYGISSKRL